MLQNELPPKNSPARRRAKRPLNSHARKTYASENDMPTELQYPIDLTGPMTPRKSASNTPVPSSQPHHPKSRSRNGSGHHNNANGNTTGNANGGKPRSKQQPSSASSPGPMKQGRQTPPQSAPPKAVMAMAEPPVFAGATFHASPAPSSLPIPSFLSKGLDSPGLKETSRGSREPSPPATDTEAAPTPKNRFVDPQIARQESPLDIFFRAQRAEKEQARRASLSTITIAPNPAPFSPPVLAQSPSEPKTLPSGFGTSRTRRQGFERTSSGISSNELDGTPGAPMLPAFSKPWSERLREARSNPKPADPAPQSPEAPQAQGQPQPASTDASEKLKQFLAISSPPTNVQNYQPATAVASRSSPTTAGQEDWNFSARPQPLPLGTAAMPRPDFNRPPEILSMENTLRQVLKLDSLNLGPSRQPNYQSS